MSLQTFKTPYPVQTWAIVTFPTASILLVTLNRPKELNAVTRDGHHELDALFQWMDSEPSICVGVITGKGRAFCVGADLKGTVCANCDMYPLTYFTARMEQSISFKSSVCPSVRVRWTFSTHRKETDHCCC